MQCLHCLQPWPNSQVHVLFIAKTVPDCSQTLPRFLSKDFYSAEGYGYHLRDVRDVAVRTTQTISFEDEDHYENFNQLAFHRKCYSTFTNKTILNRAESRRKKSERQFETSQDEGVSSETSEPIPRKVLRSSLASPSTSTCTTVTKSKHVLPPVCIICKKKNLYYNDTVS